MVGDKTYQARVHEWVVSWRTERREAAARITELEGDLKAAFREISKLAREAGEAKGRLAMSEAAGIVDGWRERAERAEARCRALESASPAEPSGWPEKVREFIDNWFAPWGSWKTEWWEDVSRDREMTPANALLVLRSLLPPSSEGGGA